MANGGDGIAQFAVDAAAVVKFLVSMVWGALVLNATDPTDTNDKDDEHEQERHAQCSDDDVERVSWHIAQGLISVRLFPLNVWKIQFKVNYSRDLCRGNYSIRIVYAY